jgi:c-di-GMP-related signal transduction protein
MALVRAHFCAHSASLCGLDANEQYLLGMLSMLPAMLSRPMETIVPELPVRCEIQDALLGTPIKDRCLLAWIGCVETIESSIAKSSQPRFQTSRNW